MHHILYVKISNFQFQSYCGTYFTKKSFFYTKKMEKNIQKILVSHFGKFVYNVKTHVCANFGYDIINLVMDMTMTFVNWLEFYKHKTNSNFPHCINIKPIA